MTTRIADTAPTVLDQLASVACPFVYANGRVCGGRITRVEAYKADVTWTADKHERWSFDFTPRSHFHLFCSEKGNHAGFGRADPEQMKFWSDTLPDRLRQVVHQTQPT